MSKEDTALQVVVGLRPLRPRHNDEPSGYYEFDADVKIMPPCPLCRGKASELYRNGVACPRCGFGAIWRQPDPPRPRKEKVETILAKELFYIAGLLALGLVVMVLL